MNFYSVMRDSSTNPEDLIRTENGALAHRSSGKDLLDLNFAVASLRSASDNDIQERFEKAYRENQLLAIKWLFFARDVRGGLGERRLFRVCRDWLCDNDPGMLHSVLRFIPEYGRFDDLWDLLDYNDFCDDIVAIIRTQLYFDRGGREDGKPISLLAKWLPSPNASSKRTKDLAKTIYKGLGMSEADYRKMLSFLRSYLDIVERKMSSNRWNQINYETVPSRANLIYKDAFLKHDASRRISYLEALNNGDAKINASVLYPHEIVHAYGAYGRGGYDPSLEALWQALPNTVTDTGSTIVVADGSGSMMCSVGNSCVSALEVANALAIYFAERARGPYHDRYITFSSHPQFVDFRGLTSLKDRLTEAYHHSECSNTNIEAVFDLILRTAVQNHLSQRDIPTNVLIISDMEFDHCAMDNSYSNRWTSSGVTSTLFDNIKKRYEERHYKLPRLIFWNVNSRTNAIPIRENDMGVALVSGFSVNICKMVMSGKLDPFECLLETLNGERYDAVGEAASGYLTREF